MKQITRFTLVVALFTLVSSMWGQVITTDLQKVECRRFSIHGPSGASYVVMTSTNSLGPWQDVGMVYADSLGLASYLDFPTVDVLFYRARLLEQSIVVSVDATSPPNYAVQISETVQTQNVLLGVYDISAVNTHGDLQGMYLKINTVGAAFNQLFTNVKLRVGTSTYSSMWMDSDGNVGFYNLNIDLPVNTTIPVQILADVAVNTGGVLNGSTATVILTASGNFRGISNNPIVLDSGYNTAAVMSSTNTSGTTTFVGSGPMVGNTSVSYGGIVTDQTGTNCSQNATMTFSLTGGNNPVYISKTTGLVTTSLVGVGMTLSLVDLSDGDQLGDTVGVFYIAPVQTKIFTATYHAHGPSNSNGRVQMTSIEYSTSQAGQTQSVTSGFGDLHLVFFH